MPLHVLDTAGLRTALDLAEEEGIRRAQAEMLRADRVLFVIDAVEDAVGKAYKEERQRLPDDVPVTLVFNKCDLAIGLPVADTGSGPPRITLSAATGQGIDMLRAHLKSCMGYHALDGGTVSARARHLDALAPVDRAARRGTCGRGAARRPAGARRDHRGVHYRGSSRADFFRILRGEVTSMTGRTLTLTENIYDYLVRYGVREAPILARLREATRQIPDSNMQIGPEQGQFMSLLVKLLDVHRYIEVGTFTGYSSLAVALALPADGRIVTCDINPQTTAIARQYWREAGVAERIDLRLQPALKTLQELIAQGGAGSFDFAFIDADKPAYLGYYEKLLELVRTGGLIAVDNTLWDGAVADRKINDASTVALRAFNEHVHRDERVDLSLLPIGDGLTLLRKRGA
jgi:caffeoyl-CoA O-methyltransferase